MTEKFNIKQLLSGASIQGAGEVSSVETNNNTSRHGIIKVIPIEISDLVPSKDNFYTIDKISELKTSIEIFGVLQNLTVKPYGRSGLYEIISGHRRYRACAELVLEGKKEFKYVPCAVQSERDEIKERILLIMTNSTTRELSDWEKTRQAEALQTYFTMLKKRDNLPGRVRDLVAEALNTSATQIARMNAITNNLAPELKDEFKGGRIGLSAAYELSSLPEETQKEALEDLQEKGSLSLNDVKEKKQESSPTVEPTPRPAPKDYPETPPDFEEGQKDEQSEPENQDFSDMSVEDKAKSAIAFLNRKRSMLFSPGEDTRVLDFIIESLEQISNMQNDFRNII